jgi:hypothetical protein
MAKLAYPVSHQRRERRIRRPGVAASCGVAWRMAYVKAAARLAVLSRDGDNIHRSGVNGGRATRNMRLCND